MFPFRSPYRDLEREERARAEGFVRPFARRRHTLFTLALRFGALAFLSYYAFRAIGRTEIGRQTFDWLRERFPRPFELFRGGVAGAIEYLAAQSIETAYRHPHLQRERSILAAALGVQSAPYRLMESMRIYYTQRQLPFTLSERQNLQRMVSELGLGSESEALQLVAQMQESGLFDELFATRTRRRLIMSEFGSRGFSQAELYQRLATSRAFQPFRERLASQLGLDEARTLSLLESVISPALYESMAQALTDARLNTQAVEEDLREIYRSALHSGELEEDNMLANLMVRAGYKPITLYQALGFGYTVNDPQLARALQYVRPEHYQYLDITLTLKGLPTEIQEAISRYRNMMNDPAATGENADQFHRAIDEDPMLSLARFLVLREPHRRNIVLRGYDLVGMARPTGEAREKLFDVLREIRDEAGEPVIMGVRLDEDVLAELQTQTTRSMLLHPETGRVVDLTYIRPASDYLTQNFSLFGIPLAPNMFSLQIMRMFPWFRPADDWFVHIDPTAQQPIVARALGLEPHERLGEDLFILGGKMYRVRPMLWDPFLNKREGERDPVSGMVDAPSSYRGVTVDIEEVEGDWTAMRVRGMTMRGMMESLIRSSQPQEPQNWWQRYLHLGQQDEASWFEKFRRSVFYDEDDLSDPRAVWSQFMALQPDMSGDLADRLQELLSRVTYRIDFDELRFARAFGKRLEEQLGQLRSDVPSPLQDRVDEWYQLLQALGSAQDTEQALAMLLRDPALEDFRRALLAAGELGSANDAILGQAIRFGLLEEAAIQGGYALSVQSDMLMNLIQMRSGLFRYIAESYTPDRPEHLFDPIPGATAGLPDPKLRMAELVRASILEATMQYLRHRGDADVVLHAALQAARDVGDRSAAAWLMASLIREYSDNPVHRQEFIGYLASRQSDALIGDALRFLNDEVRRQFSFPHVIDPLGLDEDPESRASIFVMRQGPAFGTWDWFRGYFTRWGVVENTSDLYRYFVGWRLNQMLQPYGLGVRRAAQASTRHLFQELALYRALPLLGGYMAWRFTNVAARQLFGYAPADLLADTLRIGQYGATALMDITGVTGFKKWLVSEIPGLDQYFQPRNLDELRFYHRYGLATIRYGRGWISGSRSPFVGEGVYANVPPWYRGMRSYWQAARNADIASIGAHFRGDVPLPTPVNPLAPLFYVVRRVTGLANRSFAERHRYDRPYPIAYMHGERPSPYSLAGVRAEGFRTRVADADIELPAPSSPDRQFESVVPPLSHVAPWAVRQFELPDQLVSTPPAREPLLLREGQEMPARSGSVSMSNIVQEPPSRFGAPPVLRAVFPVDAGAPEFRPPDVLAVSHPSTEPIMLRAGQEMPASPASTAATAGAPLRDYRRFMLAVGMAPRIEEELALPPGAEREGYQPLPPAFGHPWVEKARYTTREFIHRISEIQGIYGWLQRLGLDYLIERENPVVTESPGWAYSLARRFWESLYGGVDILPWQNELNELLRRFVPKRRPTEYVYYNPIPNNMPYWIPERLRYGDPYVRIHAGEIRLPGEAYRWANPARFGIRRPGPHDIRDTDIATLPAEMLGAPWERQFAVLSGLHRAIGERVSLDDVVRRRVVRRFLEEFGEDVSVVANVVSRDPRTGVRAHTMLMVGEGARATLVHAFPEELPREQIELAMMERMRQLGVRRALALRVVDEDTGEYERIPVRYQEGRLQRALAEWSQFRERLFHEIESGKMSEGLVYSPLQRLEILADIAPRGPQFRRLRAELARHQDELTEEERRRYAYALEVAERTGRRYQLYPYRNIELEREKARFISMDEQGRLQLVGFEQPVKLAGVRIRPGALKARYGLARGADVQEALARLQEELGLQRGVTVEVEHGGAGRGALRAIVRVRGRDINRELVRMGVAVEDESDRSRAARRMRQGRLRRFFNWLIDTATHANTSFHTKFLRVRSPLEEWERGHVFGTHSGTWESPVSSYVVPTLMSIANRSVIGAALAGFGFGSLFGYTVGAKANLGIAGAAAGAFLAGLRTLLFPKGFIPPRTRRKWEIDEYIDALQYVKYMRLYRREAELAREREGVDVDRLIEQMSSAERESEQRRREIRRRIEEIQRRLMKRDDPELRAELERLQEELQALEQENEARRREKRRRRGLRQRFSDMYERMVRESAPVRPAEEVVQPDLRPSAMGEHTRRALMYRALAERTAVGVGVARTPSEALSTVRSYVRDIYRQIIEEGSPREKRRFYELLPDYQKVVFHDLLAPDEPLPKAPEPTRLFHKFGLPGPSWRGWDPDVDLELLRAHLLESGGLDPVDAGVYPTERAVARFVFDQVGVPMPISSTEQVSARLASLLGEGNWQSVAGATAGSRIGGSYYVYVDYYDREYERNVYRHYVRALSGGV